MRIIVVRGEVQRDLAFRIGLVDSLSDFPHVYILPSLSLSPVG